ncbi:ATP-dependent dethiobiotin synthetase BioD [Nonomuraea phyllanthi]|uniref:ATP-dependent dethiobiotin synthetase BioD n=1 Tax=Nonomuraea phyllanthi TaxID=2219224 RepID=A0A5C4VIZ3_9ACTN|nr:dethiobiotin synthase [Nonomuraea phyllanthi]KAB8189177.1 ATP-dependent dethiobiotin synthetase BioD [Nonomuraea phyllanthi]QFY10267.1 ATP-dependent dethiobiotin synthetase BioD [Nonomuraea phyllanthi]
MRVLIITGTGTEIGKTVVTAAIASLAVAAGRRVAVLKPAQAGLAPGELCDVDEVARLAGPVTRRELARYSEPLAPATGARRSGLAPVRPRRAAEEAARLADGHDLVLVEGAGGLLVRYDLDGGTIADVPVALRGLGVDVSVLLVTTAGLGTLNTTALTSEALRTRGLPLDGLVIGRWPAAPDLATRCNLTDLPAVANAPLLGALPERCAKRDRKAFLPIARACLAPELGGTWNHPEFVAQHPEPVKCESDAL